MEGNCEQDDASNEINSYIRKEIGKFYTVKTPRTVETTATSNSYTEDKQSHSRTIKDIYTMDVKVNGEKYSWAMDMVKTDL